MSSGKSCRNHRLQNEGGFVLHVSLLLPLPTIIMSFYPAKGFNLVFSSLGPWRQMVSFSSEYLCRKITLQAEVCGFLLGYPIGGETDKLRTVVERNWNPIGYPMGRRDCGEWGAKGPGSGLGRWLGWGVCSYVEGVLHMLEADPQPAAFWGRDSPPRSPLAA